MHTVLNTNITALAIVSAKQVVAKDEYNWLDTSRIRAWKLAITPSTVMHRMTKDDDRHPHWSVLRFKKRTTGHMVRMVEQLSVTVLSVLRTSKSIDTGHNEVNPIISTPISKINRSIMLIRTIDLFLLAASKMVRVPPFLS